MADRYQSSAKKSTKKFEVMGRKEVAVRLPLPLAEVWEELQPEVEHLTGLAGLKIIRAVIEDEAMRRVGADSHTRYHGWALVRLASQFIPELAESMAPSTSNHRLGATIPVAKHIKDEFDSAGDSQLFEDSVNVIPD